MNEQIRKWANGQIISQSEMPGIAGQALRHPKSVHKTMGKQIRNQRRSNQPLNTLLKTGRPMNRQDIKLFTYCLNLLLIVTLLAGMLLPVELASASDPDRLEPPAMPANKLAPAASVSSQSETETDATNLETEIPQPDIAVIDNPSPPRQTPMLSPAAAPANQAGLMFIENVGQFDSKARFAVMSGAGREMWLTDDAMWISVIEPLTVTNNLEAGGSNQKFLPVDAPRRGVNLKVTFPGANRQAHLEPFNRLDTKVSYFMGNDSTKWQPDVPVWGGVRYVDFLSGR